MVLKGEEIELRTWRDSHFTNMRWLTMQYDRGDICSSREAWNVQLLSERRNQLIEVRYIAMLAAAGNVRRPKAMR